MTIDVLEILKDFGTQKDYLCFLEQARWGDKRRCPTCTSGNVKRKKSYGNRQGMWICVPCNICYSVTAGTIFHGTRLPLKSWFDIIYFMFSSNKRLGCRAISNLTGVPFYTVWTIQKRVRKEMQDEKSGLLKKIISWRDKEYNIFWKQSELRK